MALAEHREGLAADLVEDAEPGRRPVQARSGGAQAVEIEHGADAAVGADDLGPGASRAKSPVSRHFSVDGLRAGGPPCGTEVAERGSSGTRTGVKEGREPKWSWGLG